jgi:CBS domain containing-hemolysin-like protein
VFGDNTRIAGFGLASVVAFSIITVAHVVLGELAPKSAAIARTGRVALLLAPPMRAFYLTAKPFVDLFNGMGNLVLKPFGIPPASEAGHAPHSEDELRHLLRESHAGGMIEREEQQLSEAALVFGDLRARQVMQPRADIDSVRTDESLDEVIDHAVRSGRTRLPLVESGADLEDAVGVINAKDLLRACARREDVDLREIARPLPRVAEGTRVDRVLRDMRRDGRHIALVVDEHGTVTGLLTLEDVLEELVGEIDDEFDTVNEQLVRREGDGLHIDGSTPVRIVSRELGLELDAPHETTIGGHIIDQLGRVPEPGEVVRLGDIPVEVTAVDDVQVQELVARNAARSDGAGEQRDR